MRFEVLGPLRVHADGGEVRFTARRERVVLAALLLEADRVVPVERLIDTIWSDRPPRSTREQVHAAMWRLRRRLAGAGGAGEVIATDPAGYRMRVDPQQVDVHRFRALATAARAAAAEGRWSDARDSYRAAAALWRGPALAGLDSELLRQQADALEAERVEAREECLELELALGGSRELVGDLTELVRENPYRERLHVALMRALYRAGRPADALAAFRHVDRLLREELGTEPGEELQRLHQAILGGYPEPDAAGAAAPSPASPSAPVARELPVAASCFVGREREIAQVRDALVRPDREAGQRPAVVLLYGPGGVGKSALAVRVAHEVADEFPDGQLYVDLCGSTPRMRPLPPVEVLSRFLRRLGVPPEQIPPGEADAAAMFRSVTADRRLLLLLDNAADKEQVAALVPGTPSCGVLATSRLPLPTLDVDGRLRVGVLPDPDGLALLTGLTDRLAADPETAQEIITLSGGLPLAIRIAGGRLASRPDLPVADYATRLADRSRRLDELQLDDLAVRASIRTSYDALLADGGDAGRVAARAFRMLGLLHVPDVAPGVVAAMLAESDTETARTALDRLVDAQLLVPLPGGRYRLHDLVRLVATERAVGEQEEPSHQAVERAIAYYTGGLWRAESTTRTSRPLPFGSPSLPDDVLLPVFSEPGSARMWIDDELLSLVLMVEKSGVESADTGRRPPLWLLDALWLALDNHCEWSAAHRLSRTILDTGERRSDHELTACGHLLHGRSEACLGNYDAALIHLQVAVKLLCELDNQAGIALALVGLGLVHERRREPAVALRQYRKALEVARGHRLQGIPAVALDNMCVSYAVLGQLDQAIAAAEQGAAAATDVADLRSRCSTELNLAVTQCLSGRFPEAMQHANEALSLSQFVGARKIECEALIVRAEVHMRGRALHDARLDTERAICLAQGSGHRYVAAAARRQQSTILTALGQYADAARAYSLAAQELAQLAHGYRDHMIELLLK